MSTFLFLLIRSLQILRSRHIRLRSSAVPRGLYLDFLRSFLRLYLAGKPVVVSSNVGCFLKLIVKKYAHDFGLRACLHGGL